MIVVLAHQSENRRRFTDGSTTHCTSVTRGLHCSSSSGSSRDQK